MFFDFFKRKRQEEKKEIALAELEAWLDNDENIKDILIKFEQESKAYFSEINENLERIEQGLSELSLVSLSERKVDEKIKGIVLQNRDVYVKHVQNFVNAFRSQIPTGYTLNDIKSFIVFASAQIASFSKQSFKNFQIASELIGKEIESVVNEIQKTNSLVIKIQKVDKEKVKVIEIIKQCLKNLDEKEKVISNIKADFKKSQEEIGDIDKKIKEIEKKNQEIIHGDEWKKRQKLIENLNSLSEEIEKNNNKLKMLFLSIEKAFKKWAWKEKNSKILDYLENPLAAVKKDENEIINILENIGNAVKENELDLDEKRKSQTLKNIPLISKEKLAEFIDKDNRLKNQIQECKFELSKIKTRLISFDALIDRKNEIDGEILKFVKRKKIFEQEILDRIDEIKGLLKVINPLIVLKV